MRSRAHGRSLLGEARASQLCLRHCPTLQFKKPKGALKSIAEATRIAKCLRALFRSAAQARRIFEFTCKEASLCIIFLKCWDSRADGDGFSLLRARARTCARASRAHACVTWHRRARLSLSRARACVRASTCFWQKSTCQKAIAAQATRIAKRLHLFFKLLGGPHGFFEFACKQIRNII